MRSMVHSPLAGCACFVSGSAEFIRITMRRDLAGAVSPGGTGMPGKIADGSRRHRDFQVPLALTSMRVETPVFPADAVEIVPHGPLHVIAAFSREEEAGIEGVEATILTRGKIDCVDKINGLPA